MSNTTKVYKSSSPITPSSQVLTKNVVDLGAQVKMKEVNFELETTGRVSKVKAGCFCTNAKFENFESSAKITGAIRMPNPRITPFKISKDITITWETGQETKVTFEGIVYDPEHNTQDYEQESGTDDERIDVIDPQGSNKEN